mmetsp:Transcript_50872/g.94221  ORF Transcript_50872/g.94221 Transcript_50872/m.94221 type:complete len:697 (-) Transcript_50872:90-2180(-)
MLSSRKGSTGNMKSGKQRTEAFNAFQDVERMAQLMLNEAKTSLMKASRIIGKLIAVAAMGFMLASNCCFSRYMVPLGVLILAIAAGWLDAIGNECSCQRFFPSKSLNSMGASLFRWQWIVFWAVTLFALSSTGAVQFLQFSLHERLWKVCMMAMVPLALMLLGRALEPFRFRHARADIRKAEILVRQLAAKHNSSDASTLAPLIEPERVPLYKLGSIAKILHDIVASHDTTSKLQVNLDASNGSMHRWPLSRLLSFVYTPIRAIASDLLLWESRDFVIYMTVVLYFALVYVGSFHFPMCGAYYFPWTPFCMLAPFMGPKSKVARYVRALQENIRLAQGSQVEKKGGITPTGEAKTDLPVNWPMVVYLGGSHVAAFWALVVLFVFGGTCPLFGNGKEVKSETFIMFLILYLCSGWGITAGVHRLWSHRSYKAGVTLRFILMIFNSIANQGSIFHWARDHRVHHLYSDTIADPHDANRGFWYSHCGWLLVKKDPAVIEAGKKINMDDLKNDPIVMFQKKTDPFWNLMWCFAFPAFLAISWGDSLWNGFLIGGALRYVAVMNATWAVNSVVHKWGARPYNASHLTTENGWVSVFALGEGWHNWHHAFPWDYSASELGAFYQFNPTKTFIDVMAFLGLAWDRKKASAVWQQRKNRWEKENGRPVLESLEGPPLFKSRVITFGPEPYGEDNQAAEVAPAAQ